MAEQMGIDALRNPRCHCVLFDELPEPSCRVGTVPRRFKEVRRPLRPLALHVLGEFPTETLGKEDVAILMPLALRDPQMSGLQINVREAQLDQFRIADACKQQEFQHHDMRQLVRVPHGVIEGDQFGVR